MQVTIPPPFEAQLTPVSLALAASLGIAILLIVALWSKKQPTAAPETRDLPMGHSYNSNRFLALLILVLVVKLLLTLLDISGYVYYLPGLGRLALAPLNFLRRMGLTWTLN